MSTEIEVISLPALTSKELLARVERIHDIQQKVMKRDVDYGVIPGCAKPSLYKSGAEILLQTFELSSVPQQDHVQDLGSADEIRYRVIVPIVHIPTGRVIGHGVGECSSYEEKYKWRKIVCEQEYEDTNPTHRRIVWKHGKTGPYQLKQVRTNPADLANTILKMAKKRGLVDGTMTVTAASRNFTQDVEDLPREYMEQQEKVREDSADSEGRSPANKHGAVAPSPQQANDAPGPYVMKSGKYADKPITEVPRDFLEWARDNAKEPLRRIATDELTRRVAAPLFPTDTRFVEVAYARLLACQTKDKLDEVIDLLWHEAETDKVPPVQREEIKAFYDKRREKLTK